MKKILSLFLFSAFTIGLNATITNAKPYTKNVRTTQSREVTSTQKQAQVRSKIEAKKAENKKAITQKQEAVRAKVEAKKAQSKRTNYRK